MADDRTTAAATTAPSKRSTSSPQAMSDAAQAKSMQNFDATKQRKTTDSTSLEGSVKDRLAAVWQNVDVDDDDSKSKAVEETLNLCTGEVEALIRSGLEAYHRCETVTRELNVLKDELRAKNKEIDRLRASEENSRATIQNLFHSAEAAKTEAREASHKAIVEAKLRADLSMIQSKHDEALASGEECKRKNELLEEEIRHVKAKLTRVVQDKIKLERDQRVTMSLAKSFDHNKGSADTDYYKRKVNELTNHVQKFQATLADKNRQLQQMELLIESSAKTRLADLRSEATSPLARHF